MYLRKDSVGIIVHEAPGLQVYGMDILVKCTTVLVCAPMCFASRNRQFLQRDLALAHSFGASAGSMEEFNCSTMAL